MTTTVGQELVPHQPPSIPALWAADQGVASSLESVLSDNTRRVYGTEWRIFAGWCDEVGLTSLPAEPLTVARYVAARANSGASIATIRLATSAISKADEWAKLETPCRDPGVRASLKGWGKRLSKPQRHAAPCPPTYCPSSGSPPSSPASAAAASRRLIRLLSGGGLTWPWWPCCPTGDCGGPRLRLSPGETLCAGTTAAAASPWSAPRPTWRPRVPWSPSPPPRWPHFPASGRRGLVVG